MITKQETDQQSEKEKRWVDVGMRIIGFEYHGMVTTMRREKIE